MEYDIIVVGKGLFGSMIKMYFESKGVEVLIIDSNENMAGSKCSMGIFTEGWIKGLGDKAQISLKVIEKLLPIQSLKYFNLDKEGEVEEWKWIDRDKILTEDYLHAQVSRVGNNSVFIKDEDQEFEIKAKKAVIIAAGVWTFELLSKSGYKQLPFLDKYWGGNVDLNLDKDTGNRMFTWAPYKQSCLVEMNNCFRFSDGVTVKNPKVNDNRIFTRTERIKTNLNDILSVGSLNQSSIIRINEGYRPYLKSKNVDFVNKHNSMLYSATGGRKNSSVVSGYVAKTLFDKIYLK